MSGEPGEGDGCTCPDGLAETLVTESDVEKPMVLGLAASSVSKFTCVNGRALTYDALAKVLQVESYLTQIFEWV